MKKIIKNRYLSGFALLEILATSALMIGLIALFISFSHGKKQQQIDKITSSHLAYIANEMIKEAAPGGSCYHTSSINLKLDECLTLSDSMKQSLNDDHIDMDNFYIYISKDAYTDSNNYLLTISFSGKFTKKSGETYSEMLFNQLTSESISHFTFVDSGNQYDPIYKYSISNNNKTGFANFSFYVNYDE